MLGKSLKKSVVAVTLAVVAGLFGANAVFGATTATQKVTFSVVKAVSITAGADQTIASAIDPSSATPTGTATGALTVSSNDALGFQLQAATAAATVTESGGVLCTGTNAANVSIVSIVAGAVTGGTTGTTGTPASAITLSTSNQNLYSVVPTRQGAAMGVNVTYTVTPGFTTPANSANCSYTVPVTYTVVAQ